MTAQMDAELSAIQLNELHQAVQELLQLAERKPLDVPFGTGPTDVFPHEWASWILTEMRKAELAGEKPRPFSAWCAAVVMANRS